MTTQAASPEYFTVGPVPSGATFVYGGVLTQLDGVTPIAANMLQSLTLTFVDVDTRAVINGRDGQNVFNNGLGVTVDNTLGTGVLQWVGGAADNPFLRFDPPPRRGDVERHEAVFSWTWQQNNVTYPGSKKVFVLVESYLDADVEDGGSGADQTVGTVLEPDGVTPVTDARVWATSDQAGLLRVAGPVEVDSLGQFLLMLSAGTAWLWANSPSYAVPAPVSVVVPVATAPVLTLAAKTGANVFWTSRREIERAFGKTNVARWADLENTDNADAVADAIQAAVEDATDEARSLIDNTACGKVVMAPRILRRNVTRLAAGMLYEARGVRDTADEEGKNRFKSSVDKAYKFLRRVQAGVVHLDGCVEPTRVPFVSPHLVRHGGINGPLLTQEQQLYVNEREELMGVPSYVWFWGDGFDLFFQPC